MARLLKSEQLAVLQATLRAEAVSTLSWTGEELSGPTGSLPDS